MDLRVGGAGGADAWFVMPIAALNLFDTVAVLMAIPLCDRVIFPALRRPDDDNELRTKRLPPKAKHSHVDVLLD